MLLDLSPVLQQPAIDSLRGFLGSQANLERLPADLAILDYIIANAPALH